MVKGYTPVAIFPLHGRSPEGQIEQDLNVGFFQDRYEHYHSMNPQKLTTVYQDRCRELTDKIESGPQRDHPKVRYPNEEDVPAEKQNLIVKIMALDNRLGRIDTCELDYGKGKRNFEGDTH